MGIIPTTIIHAVKKQCICLTQLIALSIFSLMIASLSPVKANDDNVQPTHAISMHGAPALDTDFTHLPYANPDAIKGGSIAYAFRGSFNSVNPFIIKGEKVRGLWDSLLGNNVYESLLTRSRDEPFTLYGLLAETLRVPEERNWIEFTLNPLAKFADGEPVKVEDILFSIDILKEHGRPNYRAWFSKVENVKPAGKRTIRFEFNDEADRELPLLIGLMPILPKHAIQPEEFAKTTLTPWLGSGPYKVTSVKQGEQVVFTYRKDYWGKDLPIKRGFDNFEKISIDYYRDANTLNEAFKKGLYDIQEIGDPERWADIKQFANGEIITKEIETGTPKTTQGYALNTRRPVFKDRSVRKAVASLLDFDWINTNLFSGAYTRTGSFFQGSNLSALGKPASDIEKTLLAPFADDLLPEVMDGTYEPQRTDGSGRDRQVLRTILGQLKQAGYNLKDGKLIDQSGMQLSFELLLVSSSDSERVALAYQRTLATLGIDMAIRQVDAAQFEERRKSYDFDAILWQWTASLSPGGEQTFRWSSTVADLEGSFNFSGVKSQAIDTVISALVNAKDKDTFVDTARALDRLLISGNYVVPLYHLEKQWIAHSERIQIPETTALYGYQPTTWSTKETQ